MSKRSRTVLIVLGVLFLTGVGLTLYYRSQAREAQDAFAVLDAHFSSEPVKNPTISENNLFGLLLRSPFGRKPLRELSSRYVTIEYHESRNAVYYLHERAASTNACIGTIYDNDEEQRLSGHCGVPSQYLPLALELKGEQLSLSCKVSADENDQLVIERWGLVPDQDLTATLNLEETRGSMVRFADFGFPSTL